jgi:hypothetical protein
MKRALAGLLALVLAACGGPAGPTSQPPTPLPSAAVAGAPTAHPSAPQVTASPEGTAASPIETAAVSASPTGSPAAACAIGPASTVQADSVVRDGYVEGVTKTGDLLIIGPTNLEKGREATLWLLPRGASTAQLIVTRADSQIQIPSSDANDDWVVWVQDRGADMMAYDWSIWSYRRADGNIQKLAERTLDAQGNVPESGDVSVSLAGNTVAWHANPVTPEPLGTGHAVYVGDLVTRKVELVAHDASAPIIQSPTVVDYLTIVSLDANGTPTMRVASLDLVSRKRTFLDWVPDGVHGILAVSPTMGLVATPGQGGLIHNGRTGVVTRLDSKIYWPYAGTGFVTWYDEEHSYAFLSGSQAPTILGTIDLTNTVYAADRWLVWRVAKETWKLAPVDCPD